MYKGRDIIGKPIVSSDKGERFDTVEDLIFDQDRNRLLGFLVREASWFECAQVLLLKDVQVIGPDAIITTSQKAIVKATEIPTVNSILKRNNILNGTRILTLDGRDLGVMVDLYLNEKTGEVEGYEVSGGLFADAYSGRSFVPAPQTLKIGRDVAFVPIQTAQLMKEQVGGIKAAIQNTSDKVQQTAQITGDKIQELGQIASDNAQELSQVAGDKIQELGRIASDNAQELSQVTGDKIQAFGRSAATSITNAIIDPDAQKVFVIGKIANRTVITPDGRCIVLQGEVVTPVIANSADYLGVLDELYRATGGSLPDQLGEQVSHVAASLSVEQAQGRRIRHMVRSDEGSIIAASGQIVTEPVIELAKLYHQEQALLQAVGLSTGEAVRDRTSSAITLAGDRLKSTSQSTGEQIQAGATNLWLQLKETASEFQERGTQVIEEKRIKGALGRAVTRVILDQQDGVILNVGELITHQAIASAKQADVLDLLLSSVYSEEPHLSLENLRAPQSGKAAL